MVLVPRRRRALVVLVTVAALGLLAAAPATASSGVVVHRIPDTSVPRSGPHPDVVPVLPWVTKHGNAVLDAKVLTVRQADKVIAAGRTTVSLLVGVYRVTTTARYRTFTTIGQSNRTVAHTGDELPGFSALAAASLTVQWCEVTNLDVGEPPDDTANPQSGTFTAVCAVSWDNHSQDSGRSRVETGTTTVTGTVHGVLKAGDSLKTWTFSWDGGVTEEQTPVGGMSHAYLEVQAGMSVRASQPVRHVFPVRKYSKPITKTLTQSLTVR
jgi:hypothetical protein